MVEENKSTRKQNKSGPKAGNIDSRTVKNRKNSSPELKWSPFDGTETSPGDRIPYNEVPGPSRQAMNTEGVSDHFRLFIPDATIHNWVTETNRYASVCEQKKTSKTKWLEVCFEEILAFLGMVIAMMEEI